MNFYLFNKNTNYDTQKIYIKKKYKPFFLGKLKRVGNLKKDGGYLITKKSLKNSQNLLSIGIGYDWSFEKSFYKLNTSKNKVISLDKSLSFKKLFKYSIYNFLTFFFLPSFKRMQRFLKLFDYYFFFSRKKCFHVLKNLSSTNGKETISLLKILKKFNSKEIILKLDIEGYEYKILNDILKSNDFLNVILIEFHNLNIFKNRKKFDFFFLNISKKFYLSHFHINNADVIAKKNSFPRTLELTFENKRQFKKINARKSKFNYPIKNLDFPSSKNALDYKIIFK